MKTENERKKDEERKLSSKEKKGPIKEALERDLEQTKHDLTGGKKGKDLDQDVGDTVKQAAGKKPIPPENVPNPD